MRLCLEVVDDRDRLLHRWESCAEVATTTTGAELARSLVAHAARSGIDIDDAWRWWTPDRHDLAATARAGTQIRDGDALRLGPTPPARPDALVLYRSESTDPLCRLVPGVQTIGGSADDDVSVPGLPGGAAVLDIHPGGGVHLRRRPEVDGGDDDEFFGSPSAGRSVVLAPQEHGARGATFELNGIGFVLRCEQPGEPDASAVAVNRTPYRPIREGIRELEPMPSPPSAPRPSRMAVTSLVVPVASGIGMALLLGRPQFLLIVLLAPLALGLVHLFQKRRGRRTFAAERSAYREAITTTASAAAREASQAHRDAHDALPSASVCMDTAIRRGSGLWQRAAGGPHLLRVRIGVAVRAPVVEVSVSSGGDDGLRDEAERRLAAACEPPGVVPADVDLDDAAVMAVCGTRDRALGLTRAVLAQMVAHHSPEDMVVTAAVSLDALAPLKGLDWLPHVGAESSPIRVPPVAVWHDDIERLVDSLIETAIRRCSRDRSIHTPVPRVVFVVDQDCAVDRSLLGGLLDLAADAGVRVLWFGDDPSLVPRQCRIIVDVDSDDSALVSSTDPSIDPERCRPETITATEFERMARSLAPCFDADSPSRSGALPTTVTLDDLVGATADPARITAAWDRSDGSALSAPVGLAGDGPLELDLVADGPHALVAGTSGAGKSELLQAWVAAMATRHPPERCTFLFVDYKGGATAAPLLDLPHVVGSVTNLDPRLANRSLISLQAELNRRMELISGRAKDLAEFAVVAPSECPPRLVIVIDEFATLVKEVPDFLAGVVDVAQRGRSLGIHLVLATQRPAGAVNDDILANTAIRIALRVVDSADSRSVIGTHDAALLPPRLPGRAFVRCGPGAVTGAQIAWSTAPISDHRGRHRTERAALTPHCAELVDPGGETQLARLITVVATVHRDRGGVAPRRPWVPELPDVVTLDDVDVAGPRHAEPGHVATIGLADDPARQRRTPATVDLEATGGLAVFGTGGSGRTTAVRTACASLVAHATPQQVQIVAFDFAGRALGSLVDLPHARAVITGDDIEGACREIEALDAELDRRREGVGAASGEWAASTVGRPRLCVAIDGFGALRSALDTAAGHAWWERLVRVLIEGRGVGIHAVVSADRRNDLPASLIGAFGSRLVLRMTEPETMVALGVPRRSARGAELGVGRGFLDGVEIQVAVLSSSTPVSHATEATALASLGRGHPPIRRSPGLPRILRAWPHEPDVADPFVVPIGVDERDAIVRLDVGEPVAVVGSPGSGRSNLLRRMCEHVAATFRTQTVEVLVVAGERSPLCDLDLAGVHVVPGDDGARLHDAAAREPGRAILVVDDAERIASPSLAAAVEAWIDERRPVVVAAERSAVSRSLTGLIGRLRRVQPMIVLQPESAVDVEAVAGRRVRFRPGATFPVGRAVLLNRNQMTITQLRH